VLSWRVGGKEQTNPGGNVETYFRGKREVRFVRKKRGKEGVSSFSSITYNDSSAGGDGKEESSKTKRRKGPHMARGSDECSRKGLWLGQGYLVVSTKEQTVVKKGVDVAQCETYRAVEE